ncbi:hypothetical protein G8759_06735 [Spirosoma aureum]|uniref:DUF5666 domain-containing protein n=1 Tax=Spirosoma aureum TaxID=2692134 RepID=A0A6G9AIP2_9BACT|nr:hypothetical protein [Spirosoma aureum]QIP12342.1 hypothetical protein G8759_06735 [Spirosoma aureum]
MESNTKLITPILFAVMLAASQVNAQTLGEPGPGALPSPIALNAPSSPGLDGPGLDGRRPHGPRGGHQPGGPGRHRMGQRQSGPGQADRIGHERGLTSLTTVSGTVGQWIGNDDAILEGFTFTGSANTPTTVKFPPHLGQQVQKSIKPGSNVSVTGYSEMSPKGESRFRMVSLTAGKTTISDAPPTMPVTPPTAPSQATVTGKIADYQIGRDGRVNGLVLDDKTIVRVPPHVAYQLTNLATKGSTITVQGYAKNLREGQVQLEKTNILNAVVLTINGQQYLVR